MLHQSWVCCKFLLLKNCRVQYKTVLHSLSTQSGGSFRVNKSHKLSFLLIIHFANKHETTALRLISTNSCQKRVSGCGRSCRCTEICALVCELKTFILLTKNSVFYLVYKSSAVFGSFKERSAASNTDTLGRWTGPGANRRCQQFDDLGMMLNNQLSTASHL